MRFDSLIRSHSAQLFRLSAYHGSFALEQEFNSLFGKARAIDRIINPHPITRMPEEILREIFEAATIADPDTPALLAMTCMAWKELVLGTSRLWSNIKIDVDDSDTLETLLLSLLLSKNWPLDIAMTGARATDGILNALTPNAHRIRALELFLHREARVPFRVLGDTPPDGLNSLSRLAIESASYNEIDPDFYNEDSFVPSKHPLERASDDQNTINETDLFLIKSLPLLSSLTALVLHAPGVMNMVELQLPRVESLRLVMKDTPMVLENLTCNQLKVLDVMLDTTSREGWWDLLRKSLKYPRLESLALDVTLDRPKNEWSRPWDSREFERLSAQSTIRRVIVALSFSDRKYLSAAARVPNAEFLCGDLLQELPESLPSLEELRLLHVPYLHAPFIWPSSEVLHKLQRLELQVPAVVHDGYIPVIELLNLRDLRYYGYVSPKTTQLPRLRTPFLEYLEIMHHIKAIHPILVQVDRHWPNVYRRQIGHVDYGKNKDNTSKDFPTKEFLPNPNFSDSFLPVIHQSTALRELRLYLGNDLHKPRFAPTNFPDLRVLHCSVEIFRLIRAPRLEKLHLLWSSAAESDWFNSLPLENVQIMLQGIITLDIYGHIDPRFHPNPMFGVEFGRWMPCLHSLQTLIIGPRSSFIDDLIHHLSDNPTLCPKLMTIDSFGYPHRWTSLRDCIEKRNHLSMQVLSVHPIRTLRFPLALHRNISDRLKESLSGEFARPFVAVPLQPYALEELIQPNDDQVDPRPEEYCLGCIRSGNAFECLKPGMKSRTPDFTRAACPRHWNRGPDRGATIAAYNVQLSGYLEGE